MRSGICPKCQSKEVCGPLSMPDLWVRIAENLPANAPFLTLAKVIRGDFWAFICGNCSYSEFYNDKAKEIYDGMKQGYTVRN